MSDFMFGPRSHGLNISRPTVFHEGVFCIAEESITSLMHLPADRALLWVFLQGAHSVGLVSENACI